MNYRLPEFFEIKISRVLVLGVNKKKKQPPKGDCSFLLLNQDSNPDRQNQNL